MSHGTCSGGCCGTPEVPPSVISDLVIADEREARAVAGEAVPRRRWTGIDAEGVDQVKLATLWALLAGREFRDELVSEFVPLHEVSDDGPWVFRFPAPLVQLLAELEDDRASRLGSAWAGTEELELDGWDAESVAPLLHGLRSLARGAHAEKKSVLMRVSL